MNRYFIKQILKFGFLFIVLVIATIFVYDTGKESYQKYLDKHSDDENWISDNINLVKDPMIGNNVLRPDMPTDLKVSKEVYEEVITEEINDLLINNYKINDPLLIYNPYKTDNTTVNIYFHTGDNYKFEYYITTESITLEEEISYVRMTTTEGVETYTNHHFYTLYGFVPGKRNNLLIRILDDNNEVINSENFILNIPNK